MIIPNRLKYIGTLLCISIVCTCICVCMCVFVCVASTQFYYLRVDISIYWPAINLKKSS